ncbi:MAG: adenosylcobinamide-phosphate synthase CbiB [Mariprofundales bacterium]
MMLSLALLLEWWLGDPPNQQHPVAWFGRWAGWCESNYYRDNTITGLWLWLLVVTPIACIITLLYSYAGWMFGALLLWISIGWKSLFAHVRAVLETQSLDEARRAVALIVSRDTGAMQREETQRAALESLAENSSDAVIAPLFWFAVAGPVGAAVYRMINTLDASWGYRNARYLHFGRAAARIDDAANWIPARITALLILLNGAWTRWQTVQQHADSHASPNAGWPEAALAFAADIRLGGSVMRDGIEDVRPWYGTNSTPLTLQSSQRAMTIVQQSLLMASAIVMLITLAR